MKPLEGTLTNRPPHGSPWLKLEELRLIPSRAVDTSVDRDGSSTNMGEIPRTSDVSRPEETVSVVGSTPLNDVSQREANSLRIKMLDQM